MGPSYTPYLSSFPLLCSVVGKYPRRPPPITIYPRNKLQNKDLFYFYTYIVAKNTQGKLTTFIFTFERFGHLLRLPLSSHSTEQPPSSLFIFNLNQIFLNRRLQTRSKVQRFLEAPTYYLNQFHPSFQQTSIDCISSIFCLYHQRDVFFCLQASVIQYHEIRWVCFHQRWF